MPKSTVNPMEAFLSALQSPNRDVLVKSLKNLLTALIDTTQSPAQGNQRQLLKNVATGLIDNVVVNHKSKEVKILAACSASEILRIFAPNPPYTDKQLQKVFQLFFKELKGLADHVSPHLPRFPNDDTLLLKLFRTLLDLCSKVDASTRVEAHFIQILSLCLNECDHISTDLRDVLFEHLTIDEVERNPLAADVVRKLLARSEEALERPVMSFIQDSVLQPPSNTMTDEKGSTTITEKQEQYEVLLEIALNRPSLLTSTLGDLQDFLQTPDEDTRVAFVEVIGQVFDQGHGMLGAQKIYDQLFESWLKRLNDVSDAVRLAVVKLCGPIMVASVRYRDQILNGELFVNRLQDPNKEVRMAALRSCTSAALKDPDCMSIAVLQHIGDRCRDKDAVGVQDAALTGLAQLFSAHCAEYWKNGQPLPKASKKYSTVPRKLFNTVTIQSSVTVTVERLAYNTLLGGDSFTMDEKARCFMGVLCSLDADAKAGLEKAVKFKANWQERLRAFLDYNNTIRAFEQKADKTNEAHKAKLLELNKKRAMRALNLAQLLDRDEALGDIKGSLTLEEIAKALVELVKCKDRNMLKYLGMIANPMSVPSDLKTARGEISRIIKSTGLFGGSKSSKRTSKPTKAEQVCLKLLDAAALNMVNAELVPLFCQQIDGNLAKKRLTLCNAGLDFIATVGLHLPILLGPSVQSFTHYLEYKEHASIFNKALLCLSRLPAKVDSKYVDLKTVKALKKTLKEQILSDPEDTRSTKLMVRGFVKACSLSNTADVKGTLRGLIEKGVDSHCIVLDEDSKAQDIACLFRATSETLKLCPEALLFTSGDAIDRLALFVRTELMTKVTEKFHLESLLPLVNTGMKMLVDYVLAYQSELVRLKPKNKKSLQDVALPIMRLLLVLVRSQGTLIVDEDDREAVVEANKEFCGGAALIAGQSLLKLCRFSRLCHELMVASPRSPLQQEPKIDDDENVVPITKFLDQHRAPYYVGWLAMLVHHDDPQVREQFVDYLHKHLIVSNGLDFDTYGIMLAYAASFAKEPKTLAFSRLSAKIKSQRQRAEYAKKLFLKPGMDEKNFVVKVPELALGNLLYMLSHHDDYDDTDDDGRPEKPQNMTVVFDYFKQYVEFFLFALLPKKEQNNNYALVNHVAQMIKSRTDPREPSNRKIYQLAEMAQLIAKKQWEGHTWSDEPLRFASVLDSKLFRPMSAEKAAKNRSTIYLPTKYAQDFTLSGNTPVTLIAAVEAKASPQKKKRSAVTSPKKKTKKAAPVKKAKITSPPERKMPGRRGKGHASYMEVDSDESDVADNDATDTDVSSSSDDDAGELSSDAMSDEEDENTPVSNLKRKKSPVQIKNNSPKKIVKLPAGTFRKTKA